MDCRPQVYYDPCFSTLITWRVNFSIFYNTPLETLLLDALTLHSPVWNLHYFAVSSPSCACFLLDLAYEYLLHHASKFSPYPVQSLCIHWMHIVHTIILPLHDRTINLCFYIFPKCGACTCSSYRVSFLHIMVNLSLSCFLR